MAKRIVIVEDEAELASLVEYNLERHGYQVQVLGGGADTMEELEQRPAGPDCARRDAAGPRDGFDLCRAIRRSASLGKTPVLFLTARSDEVDRVLGLEIGGDDYMTKPFSPRELVARVARGCGGKKWMRRLSRWRLARSRWTAPAAKFTWQGARWR